MCFCCIQCRPARIYLWLGQARHLACRWWNRTTGRPLPYGQWRDRHWPGRTRSPAYRHRCGTSPASFYRTRYKTLGYSLIYLHGTDYEANVAPLSSITLILLLLQTYFKSLFLLYLPLSPSPSPSIYVLSCVCNYLLVIFPSDQRTSCTFTVLKVVLTSSGLIKKISNSRTCRIVII